MTVKYPKIEKIIRDESYLLWKKKRAYDKNYSSHSEDYLKGYEDCLNKIRNSIIELIKRTEKSDDKRNIQSHDEFF